MLGQKSSNVEKLYITSNQSFVGSIMGKIKYIDQEMEAELLELLGEEEDMRALSHDYQVAYEKLVIQYGELVRG